MSLQVKLLEQSFGYIKPYGTLFVSKFYENLFETHPETKSLLTNIHPEISKNQLWHDLIFVIDNLHRPQILENALQGFGARLFTYGLLPKHYPLVRNSLFNTFAQFLGSEWTTEFAEAWNGAYVTFRGLMLDGAEQTRKQMSDINSIPKLDEAFQEETTEVANSDDALTTEELLPTLIPAFEDNPEVENMAVEITNDSVVEELLPTPIPAFEDNAEEQVEQVEFVATTDNVPLEEFTASPISKLEDKIEVENEAVTATTDNGLLKEFLDIPIPELEENPPEKVGVTAATDNDLLEEFLDTPIPELEEELEEQVNVVSNNNYLPKEFLPTIVSDLEDDPEPEVVVIANTDDFPAQDVLETPLSELKDNREPEVDVIPSIDDPPVAEELANPLSESVDIVEEQVIIEEDAEDSLEKLTLETAMSESDMPESNQNIPEKDNKLDQSDESLADLSKKLKSATIEPHFTQIFSPESESAATATATAVRPVASEKKYQPETQPNDSKKGLLIGGGVAGAIGLLLLLLL